MEVQATKLYNIEFAEGDEVFIGSDIPASSKEEAIEKMMFMFMGRINKNSELLHIDEQNIH